MALGKKKSEFALEIWSFFIALIIINYLLYTMHVNLSTKSLSVKSLLIWYDTETQ